MKILLFALAALGLASGAASPAFALPPAGEPGPSDWRTPDPDDVLVIDTNKGRILVELIPEVAPAHVGRIRELTREHFYDGLSFFRVIEGFMDQTGDPQNTGMGGSEKPDLSAEFTFRRGADLPFALAKNDVVAELGFVRSLAVTTQSMNLAPLTADGKVKGWALYCPGVAAMARAEEPDSANSQFFLMRDRYPRLEQRYTAWGQVIAGMDVVKAIKVGEPVEAPQDRMDRVRLLSDLPAAQRPSVRIVDARSPWFQARVARLKVEKGADFSVCDVPVTAEVK